jgi:hypothetical protein
MPLIDEYLLDNYSIDGIDYRLRHEHTPSIELVPLDVMSMPTTSLLLTTEFLPVLVSPNALTVPIPSLGLSLSATSVTTSSITPTALTAPMPAETVGAV